MKIDLEKAIQIISNTISLLNDKSDYPYFFIVGAGVSVPEIPTASNIIEICKNKVKERSEIEYEEAIKSISQSGKDLAKEYSAWIEKAFPNPINRSSFYKNLIKNAKISSANLMLAQILHSKVVTNTVFTTNFDDKVEQALNLIGTKDFFSSENKSDNLVINVNSEEVQIVHVHGTYRFYDIANLASEISEVSTQNGTVSSGQLLKSFLQSRAPIVLGYSGWENDVIMKSIKERLLYPVPYNYIWVCYSSKDYTNLPDWLKNNRYVYFILPDEKMQQYDESIDNVFKRDKDASDNQIPATLFLGKLISQLKIATPEIFINPYHYFASLVEEAFPVSKEVLHLKHWAQRMGYHAHHESEAEKKISDLEVAIIGKNFEKICEVLREFSRMDLERQDILFLSKCISGELLEDERIINTTACKRDLLLAVLTFVEANKAVLNEINEMGFLLHQITNVDFKYSEKTEYIEILDKVVALTESTTSGILLNVNVTALGIIALLTKEKHERINLFERVLKKIPPDTKNKMLRHKELVILLYKCELATDLEIPMLIEKAEKICDEYSLKSVKPLLIGKKAEAARKIKSEEMSIAWAQECLNEALKVDSDGDEYEILKMARAVSRIPNKFLSQIDDVDKKIVEILNKIDGDFIEENCYSMLMFAEIYTNIIGFTENPATKLSYCKTVFSLEDKFEPKCLEKECEAIKDNNFTGGCKQYQDFCFSVRMVICELPLILVPDEIKIMHLQKLKAAANDDPKKLKCYATALLTAAEIGDSDHYATSSLCKDYEQVVKFEKMCEATESAVNAYKSKNLAEAEKISLEILQNGNETGKNIFENIFKVTWESAANNLAFMVRRGEVINKDLRFEDLISIVSDDDVFKHMNSFLYYLANENYNMEKVQHAFNILKNSEPEDIQRLVDWWQDEDVVGKEESVLVMMVVNYIKNGVMPQIDSPQIAFQYRIDEWNKIIQR